METWLRGQHHQPLQSEGSNRLSVECQRNCWFYCQLHPSEWKQREQPELRHPGERLRLEGNCQRSCNVDQRNPGSAGSLESVRLAQHVAERPLHPSEGSLQLLTQKPSTQRGLPRQSPFPLRNPQKYFKNVPNFKHPISTRPSPQFFHLYHAYHHNLHHKNCYKSPNPLQILAKNSKTLPAGRVRKKAAYFAVSIFRLMVNWFLLSNELIVFTGLFFPSCSAQIS